MKVYWTNTAVEHLLGIHEYIAVHSERYANTVIDRITKRADQFSTFPNSGRVVPEFQYKRDARNYRRFLSHHLLRWIGAN